MVKIDNSAEKDVKSAECSFKSPIWAAKLKFIFFINILPIFS